MFCYQLLYCVDKRRGSERVQRDDEEQMAYICRYFCVRPLNNFSMSWGELFHIGAFTGKITEATKNNKFALL